MLLYIFQYSSHSKVSTDAFLLISRGLQTLPSIIKLLILEVDPRPKCSYNDTVFKIITIIKKIRLSTDLMVRIMAVINRS